MSAAIVLLGHGSRDPDGAAEYLAVADAVRAALPHVPVEAGVLEFPGPVAPSIEEAFARAVAAGGQQILALPVLLHWGVHGSDDMPREVADARRRYPAAEIRLARPLANHPLLLDLVADRCAEAQAALPDDAPRVTPRGGMLQAARLSSPSRTGGSEEPLVASPTHHSAPSTQHSSPQHSALSTQHSSQHSALSTQHSPTVLLVGRGSTVARANAELQATARLFQERGPYTAVEVGFVSLAPPCVPASMRRCVALGARQVLVVPYFINTGLLVRRIAAQVAAARLFYPRTAFAVAPHFGPEPRLIAAVLDRAREAWPALLGPTTNGHLATTSRAAEPVR